MYQSGTGFVPDDIVPGARVFVLMQNPGETEEQEVMPACGKTGQMLNQKMLPLAGLTRGQDVSVGNILKCRWNNSNDLPPDDVLEAAVHHCTQAYLKIPESTELVILQGKLSFDYAIGKVGYARGTDISLHRLLREPETTGGTVPAVPSVDGAGSSGVGCESDTRNDDGSLSFSEWRGHLLPTEKCISILQKCRAYTTTHLAAILRDPTMLWVSELDWRRVRSILHRDYPSPLPPAKVIPDESKHDIFSEAEDALTGSTGPLVIDTEYIPFARVLTILGIYDTTRQCCYQFLYQRLTYDERRRLTNLLRTATRRRKVIFHNALADIPVIEQNLFIGYTDYCDIEDTMLAHAILWCELPHDLEFLGSIYGKHGKYKHLFKTDQLLYNVGDLVDTYSVYLGMVSGFRSDPQAYPVYREQSLKIIPILLEAEKQGIRLDKQEILRLFGESYQILKRIERYTTLSAGYPLNLNSGAQLQHYLYSERGYQVQIKKETKRPTTDDEAIAVLRNNILPFDAQKELTLDEDSDKTESVYTRVAQGADPILECRALWGETWHNINNYLVGVCKGVYNEHTESKRKKTRKELWLRGIQERDIVDRVYPEFLIHAQRTGRWSTTNPPLAQLPASYRGIICPDPEEIEFTWDWKAVEPRVLQALTGSRLLKKVFDEDFDIHTWTVCYMFGYPFPPDLVNPHKSASCAEWRQAVNWLGKDDPRRVFAKQARYEMWYGGSGSNAASAATRFGLSSKELKLALQRLAVSDPDYLTWKNKTEQELRRTSMIRTFMGRPRRFLNQGHKRLREGLDQPMQGAVSDLFNTTLVEIKRVYPWWRWGYGMHDSQKWFVKRSLFTKEVYQNVRSIVDRKHQVFGVITNFPGDFEHSIILPPESGGAVYSPEEYFALKEAA